MHRLRPAAAALTLMLVAASGLGLSIGATSCTSEASTEQGDSPGDAGKPTALGAGLRIAQINDPDSGVRPANAQMNVNVTGATYVFEDTYNETNSASSIGAIYVQDFHPSVNDAGAAPPFSGIQLYKTTFEPPSLVLSPGGVIDFTGEYEEYAGPSSSLFPGGTYQPEMGSPVVVPRFDYSPPQPTPIPLSDLNSWSTGYKWMSMLVVTNAPSVGGNITQDVQGRCDVFLTTNTDSDAVTMDNEFFDLPCLSGDTQYLGVGKFHFKSVTGIVTYFDSFHISPRSPADIVLE